MQQDWRSFIDVTSHFISFILSILSKESPDFSTQFIRAGNELLNGAQVGG